MIPILLARSIFVTTLQLAVINSPRTVAVTEKDSARLLRDARNAQSRFESVRRANLPYERGGGSGGRCDVRIGRFCYWVGEDDGVELRPGEPERIREARDRLLRMLDSSSAILPGDRWIAGQRVRYLIETGDTSRLIAAADSCSNDVAWCSALTGLALHWAGQYASADSAFTLALDSLPMKERCRWLDLGHIAEDDLADQLSDTPCEARASLVNRIFWVARPLFMMDANDLRTEHLARVVRARIEEGATSPQALGWGGDVEELMMRYGWPVWYARTEQQPGSFARASIVGHDPSPSFTFFPDIRAMDSAVYAPASAWTLRRPVGRSRYAPPYARAFRQLAHQLAVFQRGDSALVVAAYDVRDDPLLRADDLHGGLFLTSAPDDVRGAASATAARGVMRLLAPWHPMLASVELYSAEHHAAARARYGVALPDRSGRVNVSDLVLFAPSDSAVRVLDDALDHALASPLIERERPLGLFWETYGLSERGEALGIALTIEEAGVSWTKRLARSLHLAGKGSPLRVRWTEQPDRHTRIASRAVSVDLSRLAPGRYRIRLEVTPRGERAAVAEREVELTTDN